MHTISRLYSRFGRGRGQGVKSSTDFGRLYLAPLPKAVRRKKTVEWKEAKSSFKPKENLPSTTCVLAWTVQKHFAMSRHVELHSRILTFSTIILSSSCWRVSDTGKTWQKWKLQDFAVAQPSIMFSSLSLSCVFSEGNS